MQPHAVDRFQVDSPLRGMDPRWKLAGAFLGGVAILCLRTVPAAGLAFALILSLLVVNRVPWRWFTARLGGVALFLALFVAILPFTMSGEMTTIGPVAVSLHGVEVAALVASKTLAFVGLVLLVVASGPLDDCFHAAHALMVPGLLVQLLALTHRYVLVLAEELAKLRIALRLRGFRNRVNLHAYRTIGNVTGTLLVRSYERAERVSQAMRCRGFDGRYRTLRRFQTCLTDVLQFLGGVILIGALPLAVDAWLRLQ